MSYQSEVGQQLRASPILHNHIVDAFNWLIKLKTRAVLWLVWPFGGIVGDLRRRSSILRQSVRDRVAITGKTVALSRLWCAVPVKQGKTKLSSNAHIIGILGHHKKNTHCWHHGTRHTCNVS